MYLRAVHAEFNIPVLREWIRSNPLGVLTTFLPSTNHSSLQCTHIPWLLDVQDETSQSELGILRGHLARANPHAKAMIDAAKASASSSINQLEEEVMVLFNGPVHHYVTPNFYTETKPATGKVVPTWDYSAACVYGKATIYFDSHAKETAEFLQTQIDDLTKHAETSVMGYIADKGGNSTIPSAWETGDAPTNFIELLRKAIIGIRIDVTRLEGKAKMSQESSQGDRQGVIKGFRDLGTEEGAKMAEWVQRRGEEKDREKTERP